MGILYSFHGYGQSLSDSNQLDAFLSLSAHQRAFLILLLAPLALICLTLLNSSIRKNISKINNLSKFTAPLVEISAITVLFCVSYEWVIVIPIATAITYLRVKIWPIIESKKIAITTLYNGASVFIMQASNMSIHNMNSISSLSLLVAFFVAYRIYTNSFPVIKILKNV